MCRYLLKMSQECQYILRYRPNNTLHTLKYITLSFGTSMIHNNEIWNYPVSVAIEWINLLWCIYKMEHHLAIELLSDLQLDNYTQQACVLKTCAELLGGGADDLSSILYLGVGLCGSAQFMQICLTVKQKNK